MAGASKITELRIVRGLKQLSRSGSLSILGRRKFLSHRGMNFGTEWMREHMLICISPRCSPLASSCVECRDIHPWSSMVIPWSQEAASSSTTSSTTVVAFTAGARAQSRRGPQQRLSCLLRPRASPVRCGQRHDVELEHRRRSPHHRPQAVGSRSFASHRQAEADIGCKSARTGTCPSTAWHLASELRSAGLRRSRPAPHRGWCRQLASRLVPSQAGAWGCACAGAPVGLSDDQVATLQPQVWCCNHFGNSCA